MLFTTVFHAEKCFFLLLMSNHGVAAVTFFGWVDLMCVFIL